MKTFKSIIGIIAVILCIICIIRGVIIANKDIPDYGEACYFLLLGVINYITANNIIKD